MKKILVLGANGKVGRLILKALHGKYVRGMIRNAAQSEEIRALGADPFVGDLERDYQDAFEGIDIVIFTAGSGSKTGPGKTVDVDQNGAIRSMDLAIEAGVERFIMVSAQGAKQPEEASPIQHYYRAKHRADEYLIRSGLKYIIFRPGRLLDEPGKQKVSVGPDLEVKGSTHRDDLAMAIALSIDMPGLDNQIIEILSGDTPLSDALAALSVS